MACKIVLSNIINTTLFNEKSYNISVIAFVFSITQKSGDFAQLGIFCGIFISHVFIIPKTKTFKIFSIIS